MERSDLVSTYRQFFGEAIRTPVQAAGLQAPLSPAGFSKHGFVSGYAAGFSNGVRSVGAQTLEFRFAAGAHWDFQQWQHRLSPANGFVGIRLPHAGNEMIAVSLTPKDGAPIEYEVAFRRGRYVVYIRLSGPGSTSQKLAPIAPAVDARIEKYG